MVTLGRQLFIDNSLLLFPGHDNQYIINETFAEKLVTRLSALPNPRPPLKSDYKLLTAQPTITNADSSLNTKVKPNVLLGTADDGVYLKLSDIEKLGLSFTGRSVQTRQGLSKVWSGVTFRFLHDYNGGSVRYHIQHVLELPDFITKAKVADPALNTKKGGIIGVVRLNKHLILFHKGDIHMVDLGILPQIADCFAGGDGLCPMSSMKIGGPNQDEEREAADEDGPVRDLNYILPAALQVRQYAPYDAFSAHVETMAQAAPAFSLCESCRTCGRSEGDVKLSLCTRCVKEKCSPRALYCSRECQTFDWWKQHKQEHRKTVPWNVVSVAGRLKGQGSEGEISDSD